MKKIFISGVITFFFFQALYAQGTITAPNGGESWAPGSTQYIRWTHTGSDCRIKFQLYKGSTRLGVIKMGLRLYDDKYLWTVGWYDNGVMAPAGSGYSVRMVNQDTGKEMDVSDAPFTILGASQPSLNLLVPNGSETLASQVSTPIRWSAPGIGGSMRIALLQNDQVLGMITNSINVAAGQTSWETGKYYVNNVEKLAPSGSNYKVRIYTTDNAYQDDSDRSFTIAAVAAPAIQILKPGSGETICQGQICEIQWHCLPKPDNIRLRVLKNGAWQTVFEMDYFTTSFHYPVPLDMPLGPTRFRMEFLNNTGGVEVPVQVSECATAGRPDFEILRLYYDQRKLIALVRNNGDYFKGELQTTRKLGILPVQGTNFPDLELFRNQEKELDLIRFEWPAHNCDLNYEFWIDPANRIPESNESNNHYKGPVYWKDSHVISRTGIIYILGANGSRRLVATGDTVDLEPGDLAAFDPLRHSFSLDIDYTILNCNPKAITIPSINHIFSRQVLRTVGAIELGPLESKRMLLRIEGFHQSDSQLYFNIDATNQGSLFAADFQSPRLKNLVGELPELILRSIRLDPPNPKLGERVNITCAFENCGGAVKIPWKLRFEVDDQQHEVGWSDFDYLDIGSWKDVTLERFFYFRHPATYKVRFILDVNHAVPEKGEDNNEKTVEVKVQ